MSYYFHEGYGTFTLLISLLKTSPVLTDSIDLSLGLWQQFTVIYYIKSSCCRICEYCSQKVKRIQPFYAVKNAAIHASDFLCSILTIKSFPKKCAPSDRSQIKVYMQWPSAGQYFPLYLAVFVLIHLPFCLSQYLFILFLFRHFKSFSAFDALKLCWHYSSY